MLPPHPTPLRASIGLRCSPSRGTGWGTERDILQSLQRWGQGRALPSWRQEAEALGQQQLQQARSRWRLLEGLSAQAGLGSECTWPSGELEGRRPWREPGGPEVQSGVRSPEARPERRCIFLLGPGGVTGPAPPLLSLGMVSGGTGASRPRHLLPRLPLPRDQSELEGGRPACQRAAWSHLSEVLCLGLASTAEAWGLGPGLEQAAVARGGGGGQPPPRTRGGSLPLPDVLIWATGSALSGEPRGQAPARKVQQEQESESEEASASAGALRADRPDQGREGLSRKQARPDRAGGQGRGQTRGCHSPQMLPSLLGVAAASWQLAGVAQAPWTLSL